jgi:hypothetical protein
MRKAASIALVLLASVVTVFITGCSSINTNDGANSVEMKDLDMPTYKPVIVHKTQKASGNAQLHFIGIGPLGITWGSNSFADNTTFGGFAGFGGMALGSKIKNAAVHNACENSRSDMLLATKYEIKETSYVFYKNVSCTVTGFPAVITDVKEVKQKKNLYDVTLIKKNGDITCKEIEEKTKSASKK